MSGIKFGTDGWRAITDKDFNDENVTRTTKAIAKYISDNFGTDKKVLIGFDARRKADYFAKLCSELFKESGFKVFLSDKVVATPVLAYSAKELNACAIMFTASHNPPEYLGMKFIPDYAGPATTEITNEIVANIDKISPKNEGGSVELYSFDEPYITHIEKLIDFEKIKNSGIKVNYDALHSAAGKIFTRILDKYNVNYEAENLDYDENFGGKLPEPAERFLTDLKQKCKGNGNIGFSNDGDGDRFALVDENGSFTSANEVIAILLKHLYENKRVRGKLIKTVAGSQMLDIFAQKLNVEVVETPVGFKWVGKAMRENEIIIGGEESGGLSIQGHIPEKDGIIANLLIIEAKAYFKKQISKLREEILYTVGCKFINKRNDIKLQNDDIVNDAMKKFKDAETIGKYKIFMKNYADGIKLYLNDKRSCILVRKSGTEPLLRVYFESDNEEKIEELQSAVNNLLQV